MKAVTARVIIVAAALLAAGCSSSSHQSAPPSSTAPTVTSATSANHPTGSGPCGRETAAPAYRHVIWIFMENHSYDTIIGARRAPYINSLASACGLATNYHNVTHPSLPNYVAATSGLSPADLGPFTPDCSPSGSCTTKATSIFAQGESWKAYEDSMPSNCHRSDAGQYAIRHDPPPYYTTLSACATFDVPYTQLTTDLADNALPAFSFITPNLIHDMHDGTVTDGDTWLADNVPVILNSSEYRAGSTVLFITWDEGEGGSSNNCADNTTDVGCHVATLVVSPSTRAGTTSAELFNHYSLLATTEALLGLPKLGQAASTPAMLGAFNL